MNDKIEQRARELLAAEFEEQGAYTIATTIRAGNTYDGFYDPPALRAIASALRTQSPKPEAQAAGMTRQTARAWLQELLGDHDFIVPVAAFDELVEALSTPASHDAQQPMVAPTVGDWPDGMTPEKAIAAQVYIRDWTPDYVKDYIDSIAQQPAVVGDVEAALLRMRASLPDRRADYHAAQPITPAHSRAMLDRFEELRTVVLAALTPAATPGEQKEGNGNG